MDGFNYLQGVGSPGQSQMQGAMGAPVPYGQIQAGSPYGQPGGSNGTQVQQGSQMGAAPQPAQDPYAGFVDTGANWFGKVAPSNFTDGSLNGSYTKNPYLNGLQDYQISALNRSVGGHGIGDSWAFGGGGYNGPNSNLSMNQYNNMHYGYQPGNSGYLGNYLQIGQNYYNPNQYQSAIDQYNTAIGGLPDGHQLAPATTIQDVIAGSRQWGGNPYFQANPGVSSFTTVPTRTTNFGGGLRV